MKYRKLRIAWSLLCGILCLLLIALWVRSYSRWDQLAGIWFANNSVLIMSVRGTVYGGYSTTDGRRTWSWSSFTNPRLSNAPQFPDGMIIADIGPNALRGIELNLGPMGFGTGFQSVLAPHWFLVMVSFTLAGIAWLPWRFSLRTLLIAMTLVAVGLGLAVYAAR
jgi:hypothetical protein